MLATLIAALGWMMAAASPAAAEVTTSDLTGRWSSLAGLGDRCDGAGCRLTYDLAPCGEAWCGIEVKDDRTCGRVAFQLNPGTSKQSWVEFLGSYERAEGTEPYRVKASLYARWALEPPAKQLVLSIVGTTDGNFAPFRRSYPLHLVLARVGDAVCRAQPKVS
jgi:hypothetical protein